MKKILFVFPIVALLAAGCNSASQSAVNTTSSAQVSKSTQNSNPNMTPTPSPVASQTSNWKTYQNSKYGFSFQYPSEFELQEDLRFDTAQNGKPAFFLFTLQSTKDANYLISGGVNIPNSDGSHDKINYTGLTQEPFQLGNIQTILKTGTENPAILVTGQPHEVSIIRFNQKNNYEFKFLYPQTDTSYKQNVVLKILNSIKFGN